jgi:hypothetical protein
MNEIATHTQTPITMSISAFSKAADLGRSSTYKLIDAGEIESVLVGRRRLIIMQSYADFLARQSKAQAGEIGRFASPNPRAGVRQAAPPSPAPKTARNGSATPAKRQKVRHRRP